MVSLPEQRFIPCPPVLGYSEAEPTVTIDTNANSTILHLEDNVQSWKPGDTLVVASTDYSMYQAEEFQVAPCRTQPPTRSK